MRGTVLLLSLLFAAPLAAQQSPVTPPSHEHSGMNGMPNGMRMGMMASMDSLDAGLDSLRLLMRQSTGTRRMDAMVHLLDALVTQHLEMHRRMRDPEHMRQMMQGAGAPPPDSANAPAGGHDHNH